MTINLTAPTNWSELTVTQLRMVFNTLSLCLTEQERLLMLLCQLTGIRLYGKPTGGKTEMFVTSEGQRFMLKDWEIADFCDRLRWIIETKPEGIANPTRKDDYLRDMCFGDYFEADVHFKLFGSDSDEAHFDIILPKLGEEPRPMDKGEALMYAVWWNQVCGILADLYPAVLAKKDDSSETSESNPFKTLQEIHLMLNDDRPQENEKIDAANVHDVLSALQSKIEKTERREEALGNYNM